MTGSVAAVAGHPWPVERVARLAERTRTVVLAGRSRALDETLNTLSHIPSTFRDVCTDVMTFLDMTRREAEAIIDGRALPGRSDLEGVRRLAFFMRATGEVEPAPPMRADLVFQIVDGAAWPQ